ncbi:hypothetical protein HanIR_Chr02g0096021 [Helianthus annuus]|nr:hypothetical protein HanIR_Chr02g0096021 [Helianthus annuus]
MFWIRNHCESSEPISFLTSNQASTRVTKTLNLTTLLNTYYPQPTCLESQGNNQH